MPYYPGRSRRLFEAPLPDLTARPVALPAESRLAPHYPRAAFAAAYEVGIASWSMVGIDEVVAAFLEVLPPAIVTVVRPGVLPNQIRGRGAHRAVPSVGLRVADEAILALPGGAIDVLFSLHLGNDGARRWLTVSTLARPRLVFGRMLLPWFARRHARDMPQAVSNLGKSIDTPRPEPPWRARLSGPAARNR